MLYDHHLFENMVGTTVRNEVTNAKPMVDWANLIDLGLGLVVFVSYTAVTLYRFLKTISCVPSTSEHTPTASV